MYFIDPPPRLCRLNASISKYSKFFLKNQLERNSNCLYQTNGTWEHRNPKNMDKQVRSCQSWKKKRWEKNGGEKCDREARRDFQVLRERISRVKLWRGEKNDETERCEKETSGQRALGWEWETESRVGFRGKGERWKSAWEKQMTRWIMRHRWDPHTSLITWSPAAPAQLEDAMMRQRTELLLLRTGSPNYYFGCSSY